LVGKCSQQGISNIKSRVSYIWASQYFITSNPSYISLYLINNIYNNYKNHP
jgi:hypothetical protein